VGITSGASAQTIRGQLAALARRIQTYYGLPARGDPPSGSRWSLHTPDGPARKPSRRGTAWSSLRSPYKKVGLAMAALEILGTFELAIVRRGPDTASAPEGDGPAQLSPASSVHGSAPIWSARPLPRRPLLLHRVEDLASPRSRRLRTPVVAWGRRLQSSSGGMTLRSPQEWDVPNPRHQSSWPVPRPPCGAIVQKPADPCSCVGSPGSRNLVFRARFFSRYASGHGCLVAFRAEGSSP